jgi:hypothetical protein
MEKQFWTTKDGVEIPFSQVTHQHWSNIYWYHLYISDTMYSGFNKIHAFEMVRIAKEQIDLRFKGELLDWVPMYENEKKWYINQNTRKVLIEKFKS